MAKTKIKYSIKNEIVHTPIVTSDIQKETTSETDFDKRKRFEQEQVQLYMKANTHFLFNKT